MNKRLEYYLFALALSFLVGCVANTGQTKKGDPTKSVAITSSKTAFISGTPDGSARQDIDYSWTPTVSQSGVNITGVSFPSWLSINSVTGEISGTPTEAAVHNNLYITASLGVEFTTIGPFTINVTGDEFKSQQWHLGNTGQTSFSELEGRGTVGFDMNLTQTIKDGYTGSGIKVFVSDEGLELDHPDLAGNILNGFSKNYTLASPYYGDPGNSATATSGDHGTSVAGLVGAVGWNDIGTRGVAPGAFLAGANTIAAAVTLTSEISVDQASGDYDIFNYSYGDSFYPGQSGLYIATDYSDQLEYGFLNLRSNLGANYVKSSGNSFEVCSTSYGNVLDDGTACLPNNANVDSEASAVPYFIVVGAYRANGEKTTYSSTGSNLWVTAPAGEYGYDYPAMVTTDVASCALGYANNSSGYSSFSYGIFEIDGVGVNTNCDYVSTFNGTSSSAPNTSGAIALILDANSSLTSRQVKHILAATSEKLNPTDTGTTHPNGKDLTGHTYEQGWVTNSAGYSFHNWHGFGAVDVDAAVAMATGGAVPSFGTWTELSYTSTVNTAIPDASATGISNTINFTGNVVVEAMRVEVNITHDRPGELGLELTSPDGTKSILMNINNAWSLMIDDGGGAPAPESDLIAKSYMTNAFYGETADNGTGDWTLKVIDPEGSVTIGSRVGTWTGTLGSWTLTGFGHYP